MAYKLDRVANLIQRNVSEILQFEVKEDIGLVTITRVRVVNDYSYAYIYVSFLNENDKEKGMAGLEKAKGFIRSKLASRLDLRKLPALIFKYDDSFEEGQRIEETLMKIRQEQNKK